MWWACIGLLLIGIVLLFVLSIIVLALNEQSTWVYILSMSLTMAFIFLIFLLPCAIVYTIIACIKNHFKAGYQTNPRSPWEE